MKRDVFSFTKNRVINFFEGTFNMFLFFPYFFSVWPLLKTLFYPWKNIVTKKTIRGFSFTEWAGRMFFNAVSRLIGFTMRMSIILFYLCLQFLYVIILPFLTLIFIITLPLQIIVFIFQKTEEEKKAILKAAFITAHCLKEENRDAVSLWFESYYRHHIHTRAWWKLSNLFTYPPFARDWAVGYTPTLDEYTEDLTGMEYQSRIKNAVGRKTELNQIEQVLAKNEEANVLVVGEEGVGKHTIIDAFAKRIFEGQTNPMLAYKRILKLNLEKILTVYTDQKQRENFLDELFSEATQARNVIILIENIDKYVAFGPGRIDISLSIEKYGKTSGIQFIGITTPFFYQRFIFSNDRINRMFTKIDVSEISSDEAFKTLLEISYLYEHRNSVYIPYETIQNTIDKSEFYITDIPFPEKAFSLLDLACARHNRFRGTSPDTKKMSVLRPEEIDIVLSEKTHIPTRLTEEMRIKLVDLEKLLSSRVIFQDEAISKLAAAMRRSFILLGKRKKPLASFLFLGPTGVGKTETAKALAEIFFGGTKYLLRFDMSLYQTVDDIKTLIGSVESGVPGLLSKAIRENPFGVLLLDEIEKANKDLLNIFLTLTDEGYFTDGFGKRVDCKNLIIVATSNAGADFIFEKQKEGQTSDKTESAIANEHNALITHLVSQHLFTPEFLNRFDGVVIYRPVTELSIFTLARSKITAIQETIFKLYKIRIEVSDETLKDIVAKGYDPAFGARNLERVLTQELEDKIAKLILERRISEGQSVTL